MRCRCSLPGFVALIAVSGLLPCGCRHRVASSTAVKSLIEADDRREPWQLDASSPVNEWRRAVAFLPAWSKLTTLPDGRVKINLRTYAENQAAEEEPLCATEPFAQQPAGGMGYGTGFLVADNVLASAGHIFSDPKSCHDLAVVFGFAYDTPYHDPTIVEASDVYHCLEVIKVEEDDSSLHDYAVVRLDRPVKDRPHLEIRREGKLADSATLMMVGHPLGLPQKITGPGKLFDNSPTVYFASTLDTYPGNSGAPVFDASTGLVEGILVRGEQTDITLRGGLDDWRKGCWYSKVYCLPGSTRADCDSFDLKGAHATRTTLFSKFVP